MSEYTYQTNGEELKCINCKNTEFKQLPQVNGITPFECQRCHFVSWFPEQIAPQEKPLKS